MSSFEWPPTGGGSGTVTSVGLADGSLTPIYSISGSPVTTSGTLTFSLNTQTANYGFLGPASGVAAQPGFRAFVAADISSLFGNLTDAGTDGITIGSGSGVVLGSGTTISQHVADTTHNGYLSSADWNTFNGKQATGNYATSGSGDVSWSAPSGAGPVTTSLVATTNASLVTLSGLTTAGSLATIGTIGTGVWHGTAVGAQYGGTGIDSHASTGYPSLSSGTWSIITATQLTAALNLFTSSLQGLTPSSGGGTTNFLRADGSWAAPAGSGTVTSVTFTGDGTVLSSTPSSAVTTTGTLTAVLATQTARTFLSGPQSGSAATPTFKALTGPTFQQLTSGSTQTAGYVFVISSGTAPLNGTYTNNGHTFTVSAAITAQTTLFATGTGAPTASGTLTEATGGGANLTFSSFVTSGIYTAPTTPVPLYIEVEMAGSGAGGAASGTGSEGTAGAGILSVFGYNLLQANGGNAPSQTLGGTGGTASVASGPIGPSQSGGAGGSGGITLATSTAEPSGGLGGSTIFGGAGLGNSTGAGAGGNGAANTGAGGGGAGGANLSSFSGGGGGGSGGSMRVKILSPASTYAFSVSTGGAGGSAGSSGAAGGNGGSGIINVWEYYQ